MPAFTVRFFDDNFQVPGVELFAAQRSRHRTLGMRHEASVRIINLIRTAESPSQTVTSRLAAPQVGRALVVFFDDADRVARVNRYRDKIEQCLISRLGMLKRETFVRFGQIRNFRAARWFTSFARSPVMANAIRSIAMATFRLTRIASRNFRFVHNLEQHAPSFPILLVKTVSRKLKNWAQRARCDRFRRFQRLIAAIPPRHVGRGGLEHSPCGDNLSFGRTARLQLFAFGKCFRIDDAFSQLV